ncbi:MAG: CAP domain-containing protein [bacterium]|nr:CAP domain-containing protein [bacterium]
MKIVKTILLVLIIAAAFLRFSIGSGVASAADIDSGSLMEKINKERTSRAIPALVTSQKLNTAAAGKTSDMFSRGYFDHVDPDGHYVWPLVEAAGYVPYLMLGENLAIDFSTEEGIVRAWINSPTHRDNMLRDQFEDQGLAAQYGNFQSRYTSVVTSLFGSLAAAPAPAIVKASPPAPAKTTVPPAPTKPKTTPPQAPAPKPETPQPPAKTTVPPAPQPVPAQSAQNPETQNVASSSQTVAASQSNLVKPKNEPAIALTPVTEKSSDLQTISLKNTTPAEADIYQTVRIIFIILVILLISTSLYDGIFDPRVKGLWDKSNIPMLLCLLIASLLTIRMY